MKLVTSGLLVSPFKKKKTRRRRKGCLCWGKEPHFKGLLEYGVPNPIQNIIMASSWLNT
jgi:hypothetical protein